MALSTISIFLSGWKAMRRRSIAAMSAAIMYAVRRSCEIKAEVVGVDEREQGLRAILNLGHTFGHAIETATGYGTWLHGEAVAAGMMMAADMSHRLGWITSRAAALVRAIERFQLPTAPPRIGAQRARELMGMDKKVMKGQIRLVLLRKLGQADIVSDYPTRGAGRYAARLLRLSSVHAPLTPDSAALALPPCHARPSRCRTRSACARDEHPRTTLPGADFAR